MRTKFINASLFIAALALGGCVTTQDVQQVELCLSERSELDRFYIFMQELAEASNLTFEDGSEHLRKDAESIEQSANLNQDSEYVIYFGGRSRSGSGGFTAGNLGLNPLQIGLGMFPTKDRSFDSYKINEAIEEITSRWSAQRIPASETFRPRAGCGDARSD